MQHRAKRYIQIAEQLRRSIMAGEFQPGSKLPSERELARRYAVGRSSVREALTILQGMGLIEIRHGYGTRVLPQADQTSVPVVSPPSDAHEILEARLALQCQNVELAAQRATKADLSLLADTLWAMEAELKQGQIASETELRFQLAVAAASHNRPLQLLTKTLIDYMRTTLPPEWWQTVRQIERQERLLDQYRHIFRAIAVGDAERSVALMREHVTFLIDALGHRAAPAAADIAVPLM